MEENPNQEHYPDQRPGQERPDYTNVPIEDVPAEHQTMVLAERLAISEEEQEERFKAIEGRGEDLSKALKKKPGRGG